MCSLEIKPSRTRSLRQALYIWSQIASTIRSLGLTAIGNSFWRIVWYNMQAYGGTKCDLTRLQFVTFWISSIVAHACPPGVSEEKGQTSPKIFIVGTHRDSIPGTENEKQEYVSLSTHVKYMNPRLFTLLCLRQARMPEASYLWVICPPSHRHSMRKTTGYICIIPATSIHDNMYINWLNFIPDNVRGQWSWYRNVYWKCIASSMNVLLRCNVVETSTKTNTISVKSEGSVKSQGKTIKCRSDM